MAKLTPRDVAAATVIAVVVILAVAAHKWRLRAGDIVGYWRPVKNDEDTGGEYQINPGGHVEGRSSAKAVIVPGAASVAFPRRVCIDGRCGSLDLSGRHLSWGGGERWVREGVFDCASCLN